MTEHYAMSSGIVSNHLVTLINILALLAVSRILNIREVRKYYWSVEKGIQPAIMFQRYGGFPERSIFQL